MYSSFPTFILGFHGCDKSIQQKVLSGEKTLKHSNNDYDWLGNGIYFGEHNPDRAFEWAEYLKARPEVKEEIKEPAVIGAVIDVGFCFNLLDARYIEMISEGYTAIKELCESVDYEMPENKPVEDGGELIDKKLDCFVFNQIHFLRKQANERPFDTVRGVFGEGDKVYPTAGVNEKNHIQICVRNPNCIKGYFHPREIDPSHPKP